MALGSVAEGEEGGDDQGHTLKCVAFTGDHRHECFTKTIWITVVMIVSEQILP